MITKKIDGQLTVRVFLSLRGAKRRGNLHRQCSKGGDFFALLLPEMAACSRLPRKTPGAVSQTDVACRNDESTRHRRPDSHRARRAGLDPGSVGCGGRRVAQRGGAMGDRPRRPGHDQPHARRRGTRCRRREPDVRARQDGPWPTTNRRRTRGPAAVSRMRAGGPPILLHTARRLARLRARVSGAAPPPPSRRSRRTRAAPAASPPD